MTPMLAIRAAREAQNLTQAELAARAGISRQSLGAIEAARVDPSLSVVSAIAAALGLGLDALVGAPARPSALSVTLERPAAGAARVVVGRARTGWVAYPLSPSDDFQTADGLLGEAGQVELLGTSPGELEQTLVIPGCAPLLALAARRAGLRATWLHRNSHEAMALLKSGRAMLAGVHGTPHGGRPTRHRTSVARWESGLVMRSGTRLRSLVDLARRGTTIAVREPGAQTRQLLESLLSAAGVAPEVVLARAHVATSHLDVARAVAWGAADVAFAPRTAALALGLTFVPLAAERFDLVLAAGAESDPRVTRFLDTMRSPAFQREAAALGYEAPSATDP